jgi:hypothetical protein
MSEIEKKVVQPRNPSDPRRDAMIILYDKETISKITSDPSSNSAEFYQLMSMFVGIFAFMMKVKTSDV